MASWSRARRDRLAKREADDVSHVRSDQRRPRVAAAWTWRHGGSSVCLPYRVLPSCASCAPSQCTRITAADPSRLGLNGALATDCVPRHLTYLPTTLRRPNRVSHLSSRHPLRLRSAAPLLHDPPGSPALALSRPRRSRVRCSWPRDAGLYLQLRPQLPCHRGVHPPEAAAALGPAGAPRRRGASPASSRRDRYRNLPDPLFVCALPYVIVLFPLPVSSGALVRTLLLPCPQLRLHHRSSWPSSRW